MNIIKTILLSCTLMYSCALLSSAPASAASASSSSYSSDDESEKPVEQLTTREQIEYLFEPARRSIEDAESLYSNSIKVAAQCYDNNQSLKQLLDAQTKAKHAESEQNKQADTYELFKKSSMNQAQKDAQKQEYENAQNDTTNFTNESTRLIKNLPNEIWQEYLTYLANSGLCRARFLTLKLEQQEAQNYIQTQKLNAKFAKQLQTRDEEIALLRAQLAQGSMQTSPPAYQHRAPAQLSIPIEQSFDQAMPTIAHETGTVFFSPRTAEKVLDAECAAEFPVLAHQPILIAERIASRFLNVEELVEPEADRTRLLLKKDAFIQKLRTNKTVS